MRNHRGLGFKHVLFGMIAAILTVGTALLPLSHAWAQPDCNWNCMIYDCCGREVMCGNGSGTGTYGAFCPTFCSGTSVPAGTPCPY